MRVIARDVVAIWKGIPALIVSALDDWVEDQLEQERQREEKKALEELHAAIDEAIELMHHDARIPTELLMDPYDCSSETMKQLEEAMLRQHKEKWCGRNGCGHSE